MGYAEKINNLAKQNIANYLKAVSAFEEAEKARKATPIRHGFVEEDYQIKALKADLAYKEAESNLKQAKESFRNSITEFDSIRSEILADLRDTRMADPTKLDSATVALLQSGICTPDEILSLYRKAPNLTTRRFIGKYAGTMAEAIVNDPLSSPDQHSSVDRLMAISYEAEQATDIDQCPESMALSLIRDVLVRIADNPLMADYWDSLTENALNIL